MLFTGEYEHTIDAKHRLAIPSEIRSRLDPEREGEAFYLVPGPNGALWLWPERTFEQMAGVMERSLLPAEEMLEFEELMFPQASRLELDKAGRVRLPERMIRQAELGQQVMILGVRDHLELRDPGQWEEIRKQKLARQGEIMLRARRALDRHQQGGGTDRP
ncbi:MAG: hypothetical protein JSV91_08200 [Phycisphaerales bacterium]|nr:MAG: hypothetical protein JSV91_08200 [Phycisphaerales bacterium]